MRLLLDTHVFLWCLQDDRRLSAKTREAIREPASDVFVSAASIWELAIKLSLRKLKWKSASTTLHSSIDACGFAELPVTARHAAAVRDLAHHHADPFDRLLVAQAICEELRVVTADDTLAAYGVPTLDPA